MALPSGTVTLLFTDIEGSTRLLHELGDVYAEILADHRRTLRTAAADHGGVEVDTQGDAFLIAFSKAPDALAAAQAAQRALSRSKVRVRMGLHTGDPTLTAEGYVGIDVHRGARICAAGHGGQVLLSKSTRQLIDPSVELIDLGEHRLKDLPEPEWLFQLVGDDLERRFPPLRSLNNTNLPAEASEFVGRGNERQDLSGLLGRDEVRLLTLTGPGGVGKSRLALCLASDFIERFKNGVFFVPLGAVTDPAGVLATTAYTLGAKETASGALVEDLGRHLRDKQILLVLDNFEHLLTAASDVSLLLAAAPQLKIVVTSRERLRVAGEHEYAVPPLPDDDAVALFDVRARAAKPSFSVAVDRAQVVAICRRLDGLPLAVELAAARVKLLSTQALFARLEARLPTLTGGLRDQPERQRTLRATIDWSYQLLEEQERKVFARLSVFVGGWEQTSAEAVCGATLDVLWSLLDKSLLRHETGPDGIARFWMLETIREFARESLEAQGETDAVRGAHARYFAVRADTASEGRGHGVPLSAEVMRRRPQWLDWLELERHNLAAALSWLIDRGEAEAALQLLLSTWRLWFVRGPLREGQVFTESVLALEAAQHSPDFGFFVSVAAEFPRFRGDHLRARILEERAIERLRKSGQQFRLATAIEALASIIEQLGDYTLARTLHEQCLSIGQEIDEPTAIAHALNGLTVLAFRQCDYPRMAALAEEELAMNRKIGAGISESLHNLAEARRFLGEFTTAARLYQEGLSLAVELGDVTLIPEFLDGIADVAVALGDFADATSLWAVSSRLFQESDGGPSWNPAETELGIARARSVMGPEAFRAAWETGRTLRSEEGVRRAMRVASTA